MDFPHPVTIQYRKLWHEMSKSFEEWQYLLCVNGLQRSRGCQMMLSKASDMSSLWFFVLRLCMLTLKIHWFNSLQSSLRIFRDWGLKQLRRNAYMCVNFKLEYILTLRHNRSRADLINLAYFFSLWCLRKMWYIDRSGAYDMCSLWWVFTAVVFTNSENTLI